MPLGRYARAFVTHSTTPPRTTAVDAGRALRAAPWRFAAAGACIAHHLPTPPHLRITTFLYYPCARAATHTTPAHHTYPHASRIGSAASRTSRRTHDTAHGCRWLLRACYYATCRLFHLHLRVGRYCQLCCLFYTTLLVEHHTRTHCAASHTPVRCDSHYPQWDGSWWDELWDCSYAPHTVCSTPPHCATLRYIAVCTPLLLRHFALTPLHLPGSSILLRLDIATPHLTQCHWLVCCVLPQHKAPHYGYPAFPELPRPCNAHLHTHTTRYADILRVLSSGWRLASSGGSISPSGRTTTPRTHAHRYTCRACRRHSTPPPPPRHQRHWALA